MTLAIGTQQDTNSVAINENMDKLELFHSCVHQNVLLRGRKEKPYNRMYL